MKDHTNANSVALVLPPVVIGGTTREDIARKSTYFKINNFIGLTFVTSVKSHIIGDIN